MTEALETSLPLYESAVFRSIAGSALRPGGTAITETALDACFDAYSGTCPGEFPSLANARMLDLGCGAGATLELLRQRGYQCLGLDLSAVLLREASQKGPVVQGDAACPPFADQSFDILFCECVFSLLSGKAEALARYKKLLKPGGMLILSDIFAAGPTGWQGNTCAARALSVVQMQELLQASGFQVFLEADQTRYLRELAAKMILYAGSVAAFQKLWQQEAASRATISPRTGAAAFDASGTEKSATVTVEREGILAKDTRAQAKPVVQPDRHPALPVALPDGVCACQGSALRYVLFIAKVA